MIGDDVMVCYGDSFRRHGGLPKLGIGDDIETSEEYTRVSELDMIGTRPVYPKDKQPPVNSGEPPKHIAGWPGTDLI
jgi:hypothetical protein